MRMSEENGFEELRNSPAEMVNEFLKKYRMLEEENAALRQDNDQLRGVIAGKDSEIACLKEEFKCLLEAYERLKKDVLCLEKEYEYLKMEYEKLKQENDCLKMEKEELQHKIFLLLKERDDLREIIDRLKTEFKELSARYIAGKEAIQKIADTL